MPVLDRLFPPRLGQPFRWLVGASWVSNLGDGLLIAAGPLLVASETRDPFLVAAAWMLQYLPWLLFGLLAGVVADRVDRRRLVVLADGARLLVTAVLVATVVTGEVDIAVVLVAVFVLGVGETFADTATQTLLPMVVGKRDLGLANARIMVGHMTLNQLAGPPVGALLFALDRAWPLTAQVVCLLASVLLLLRVRLPDHGRGAEAAPTSVRRDVAEGLRWLWHHAAVRTLALTIFVFNITFGAAWSVLVLFSYERLGLGEAGFGLLTGAMACGGIVGTLCFGWLERHLALGTLMRVGLVVETLTHLWLALVTSPWLALLVFFVFGAHASVWGTLSAAVRQRAVPTHVQGRVASVYMIGVTGGIVLGALIGGLAAGARGVTAPFWFAFVGSAVFLVLIWRQLAHIAHADEEAVARG